MRISLIVAMAKNRVIGADNGLPWHLSADLKRFKTLTMGHPLVMGRKTHQSIGRPLPGRTNIVLTSDPGYLTAGCIVVHSIAEALARAEPSPELFVIGGASLYAEFLPSAARIHLTLIQHDYPGDVQFPEIDSNGWRQSEREDIDSDPSFPYPYSFILLERMSAPDSELSVASTDRGVRQ